MTSDKHNFEELTAPAAAAKQLGISVATLRKYSLIVEKVTANKNYYDRTKQKARLYHKKDIADLTAFHNLARNHGLTLEEAARQVYSVSDKTAPAKQSEKAAQPLADTAQVVKLLGALQQTISTQNQAIESLQQQLNRIEKQNTALLSEQKQLPAAKQAAAAVDELPDISGIVTDTKKVKRPQKSEPVRAATDDQEKSSEEVHAEILNKAKENAEKQAQEHRTLEDMQLPKESKHWWQRFINL